MSMNPEPVNSLLDLDRRWRDRQAHWARRLGRLKLGAEPIEEQLARYRRVTWGLLIVPGVMALIFLSLFTVFGRPDIGLIVFLLFFAPIALFSWLGYWSLARNAAAYAAEEARFEAERQQMRETADGPRSAAPSSVA
jgi:hypothetical protein